MHPCRNIRLNVVGSKGVGKTSLISSFNDYKKSGDRFIYKAEFDEDGRYCTGNDVSNTCKIEIFDNPPDFDGDVILLLVNSVTWREETIKHLLILAESGVVSHQPIYIAISRMDEDGDGAISKSISEMSHSIIAGFDYPKELGNNFKGNIKVVMTSSLPQHTDYIKMIFNTIITEAYKKKRNPDYQELMTISANLIVANESAISLKKENGELTVMVEDLRREISRLGTINSSLNTVLNKSIYASKESQPIKGYITSEPAKFKKLTNKPCTIM
jgi:hypothetical protein